MNDIEQLKALKGTILAKYTQRSDLKAFFQVFTTVVPFFALFYLATLTLTTQWWVSFLAMALLILWLMRIFMMMHDCGHGALFQTKTLNDIVGFFMGVLCGIPAYVWSKHHAYHHSTNGNWSKYQGPLSIISTEDYAALSSEKKKSYQNARNIRLAPLAGFMYFIFNPRFNWLKGTLLFALHFLKHTSSGKSVKEITDTFTSRYWANWTEYWHQAGNNICLVSACIMGGMTLGWFEFFTVYVLVISLSGALGIVLFTVQHNFEGSYATGDDDWDYYKAGLEGTSYLVLPTFLNWFTADIGYHHLHHLSAKIPNYNLSKAHIEYQGLFTQVPRIKLTQVSHAFKYILWDKKAQKLVTIADFNAACLP